ncbi:hypothetical protein [Paenibacillus naphthalenovorans]|nr:hypothetical protein [Paenibacillus naphthalenovorans]
MDYYKFYRIMDAKITRKDGVFEPPSRLMATFLEDWVNGRITPSPCNTPAVTLREESYYGLTVKIRWPGYRFVRQFVPGKQPNFGEMGFCHYVTDYEYTYYFYKTADVFYAANGRFPSV